MDGECISELNPRSPLPADDTEIPAEVRARAARMVVRTARDAAEAAQMLEMLGLSPRQRHLRVVA